MGEKSAEAKKGNHAESTYKNYKKEKTAIVP